MSLKCGIVGLPNVGKSTLFNALTATENAESANFPFCTIEPNIGRVSVPDERLDKIAKIVSSVKVIPTSLEFVDIAGLVEGASKGEGLGNQFLANIRETDDILHVVRCFEDENVTHISGSVDPIRDIEIIHTELMLADMEMLSNKSNNLEKKIRLKNKEAIAELELIKKVMKVLEKGKLAIHTEIDEDEHKMFKNLQLLTAKKTLYVCNVGEDEINTGNEYSERVSQYAKENNSQIVNISAKIESEISLLEGEEKQEFIDSLEMAESGLSKIIKASYKMLNLITFFTAGPNETRAWTIKRDTLAPEAAGVIHTDFQRGFIAADTISYQDYIDCQGEKLAKETGKFRTEGKTYIVKDGDIFHFKFNV